METDYVQALYEKMAKEQEAYRNWLLEQPPQEILFHAYEYSVREDILLAAEDIELSQPEAKAFYYRSPCPLGDVYNAFCHVESDHMDIVRGSLEFCAGDALRQQRTEKNKVDADPEL